MIIINKEKLIKQTLQIDKALKLKFCFVTFNFHDKFNLKLIIHK